MKQYRGWRSRMAVLWSYGRSFRPSALDDATAIGTITGTRLLESVSPHSENSGFILDALRRSTSRLSNNASPEEIAAYVRSVPDAGLGGLAANIKGITHEYAFAAAENADNDSVTAELFPDTSHPAADVLLRDAATGLEEEVQLKATDSVGYAVRAVQEHPAIPVLATEEAADAAHGVLSSGISNAQLEEEVASVLESLSDSAGLSLAGPIVAATLVLARHGLRLALTYDKSCLGETDGPAVCKEMAWNAARAGSLVALSLTPIGPAVNAYLVLRLARALLQLLQRETSLTLAPSRALCTA